MATTTHAFQTIDRETLNRKIQSKQPFQLWNQVAVRVDEPSLEDRDNVLIGDSDAAGKLFCVREGGNGVGIG